MGKLVIEVKKDKTFDIFYKEISNPSSKYSVVFCHGFDSSSVSFSKILPKLGEKYSCYVLDYPGHGLTEAKVFDMKLPIFAKSVAQFIEKKSLNNVILVGHSLGGGISSYLWNNKNVIAHILVAPINPSIVGKEKTLRDILLPSDMEELKNTWKKLIHDKKNVNAINFSKENAKSTLIRIKKYRPFNMAVAKDVLSKNRQWEILSNYLSIDKPCKLIFGGNDKIIPTLSSITWLKKIVKHIDVSVIEGCGHSPQFEKPKETVELIDNFICSL